MGIKVSELPTATAPDSDDLLLLVEDGVTKNIELDDLITAIDALRSGSYTPVIADPTGDINPFGSLGTEGVWSWTRRGSYVDVFGILNVDFTAQPGTGTVTATLPVASATFVDFSDAIGIGTFNSAVIASGASIVTVDPGSPFLTNKVRIVMRVDDGPLAGAIVNVHFRYRVL